MPRKIHWTELRIGIIGAAAVAALVISILLFARVGALHGKKATLYIVTGDATGLLKGSEIWLSGQKIGQVQDVRFRPSSADTAERLVIEALIVEERFATIRRDSHAEIRPGSSMIGAPVVFLTAGSVSSPGLHAGDTIHAAMAAKVTDLGGDMMAASEAASGLATEVRGLAAKMGSPTNTVGAIRSRGIPGMATTKSRMSSLMAKATRGNGSIGLATRSGLGARVSRVMAGVDSIMALASSNRGNIGRFRRDSTLMPAVKRMMAEVDSLRSLASNPVGTIGRAHADSTLIRALDKTHASLDSLMRDIKSHPLRYIVF